MSDLFRVLDGFDIDHSELRENAWLEDHRRRMIKDEDEGFRIGLKVLRSY